MARPVPVYRLRARLPAQLAISASPDTSVIEVLDADGAAEAPASGTYQLLDRSDVVLASGAVTLDGTTVVSPAVDLVALKLDPDDGYVERWALTMSDATVVPHEREAYVVRYALTCPIGPDDITTAVKALGDGNQGIAGDLALDDYIEEAWTRLQLRIIESGKRPWLAISPYAFRTAMVALTCKLVFEDLTTSRRGDLLAHAERYGAEYEAAWRRIRLTEQTPDGDPRGDRESAKRSVLWLGN